jgi:hypothetical protein
MLGRFFFAASIAGILAAAPAAAQDSQQPIIKPPAGQGKADQPSAGQQMPDAGGQQVPKGSAEQDTQKLIQPNGEEAGQQPSGQAEQKTKKLQQEGQPDQMIGEQPPEKGDKSKQVERKKQSDPTATGSTSKVDSEITPEKKTIIREKIVTSNVKRVERDDIDIDISVGVIVPTTIALQPLPVSVIEVLPAYRGYLYFVLADGTIVIVEPGTLQIVYVLTA